MTTDPAPPKVTLLELLNVIAPVDPLTDTIFCVCTVWTGADNTSMLLLEKPADKAPAALIDNDRASGLLLVLPPPAVAVVLPVM